MNLLSGQTPSPVTHSAFKELNESCDQISSESLGEFIDGSCKHSQVHEVFVPLSGADKNETSNFSSKFPHIDASNSSSKFLQYGTADYSDVGQAIPECRGVLQDPVVYNSAVQCNLEWLGSDTMTQGKLQCEKDLRECLPRFGDGYGDHAGDSECISEYQTSESDNNLSELKDFLPHVIEARKIFDTVINTDQYNYQNAKVRVPSGLNIQAWKDYLENYHDGKIVQFLEYGWPISFDRSSPLVATDKSHPSGRDHPISVEHYINTELGHGALLGPFNGLPVNHLHTSPLMSRPKKDSEMRRIVLDLSWPDGFFCQ